MIKSGRDFQGNPRSQLEVSVAWQLRENFKAIFTCQSYAEAKENLDLWIKSVEETR